ncbi:MAG: 50S ribosomal protein L25 [Thermodesulfobacteriota bacterium]
MVFETVLTAQTRDAAGKGPARRFRSQGLIPAVFYGPKQPTRHLIVPTKELKSLLTTGGGAHSLFRLRIEEGDQTVEKTVMIKEHQVDPVKKVIIHADFYEVDVSRPIEMEVPVELVGKPVGLDRGGMLQQLRHTITVLALPRDLPEKIEVDVSAVDAGHSIHVADLKLPSGMTVVYDDDFALATVIMPKGAKPEAEAEGEAAAEEAAGAKAE